MNHPPAGRPPVPALLRRSLRDTVMFFCWFLVFFSCLAFFSRWVTALYSVVAFCYLAALQPLVIVFGNLVPDVPSMTWSYLMWLVVPLAYTVVFWVLRFLQLLIWPFQAVPLSAEHKSVVPQNEVV